jgi:hypothetical protein
MPAPIANSGKINPARCLSNESKVKNQIIQARLKRAGEAKRWRGFIVYSAQRVS